MQAPKVVGGQPHVLIVVSGGLVQDVTDRYTGDEIQYCTFDLDLAEIGDVQDCLDCNDKCRQFSNWIEANLDILDC